MSKGRDKGRKEVKKPKKAKVQTHPVKNKYPSYDPTLSNHTRLIQRRMARGRA